MFFVSSIIDHIAKLRGLRAQHRLHLFRMARWRKGEAEWHLLDHLVDPRRAAIDVGANIGDYTGRLAQLCPSVHAFEPIPWLAQALRPKLPANVTLHAVAASNAAGTAELRIPGIGAHALATLEQSNALNGADDVQLVPCTLARLDDVVQEPVGFIKVDVEGHEMAVLRGASRILQEHRPVLLVESEQRHNPAAPRSVFSLLQAQGYAGFFLHEGRLRGTGAFQPDLPVNNFIFVPDR